MTDNRTHEDAALDLMFEAARSQSPRLKPDFLARLEADALAEAEALTPRPVAKPAAPSLWDRLLPLVTASGLTATTALGVWIGLAMPDTLNTLLLQDATLTSWLPTDDSTLLALE